MTFTLSPFSVTYACSCHALFLPLCPISCLCCSFFLFHILLHTLSCSCLRLCLRKVAQVSLSAVELPGHLFVPALPSGCLVFFFATKKENKGPCDCSTDCPFLPTLRDRGHGLVPSPNVNFGYLFPTSDYTALAICPLPLMLLPFICSVINKL